MILFNQIRESSLENTKFDNGWIGLTLEDSKIQILDSTYEQFQENFNLTLIDAANTIFHLNIK